MEEEPAKNEEKRKPLPAILSYDWYSSGFYPWRLVFFMVVLAIAGVFVCSHINVKFDPPAHKDKYPETVFFINNGQMFSSYVDQRLLPLTRTGPVWADPVSSGMDGELFFPLGAGLSERAELKTLEADPFVGRSDFFVNYLSLAPVNVSSLVMPGFQEGPSSYVPIVEAWNEDMEGAFLPGDVPGIDVDLRGVSSSFWVRVNERGAPASVVLLESSKDDDADSKALDVVRKLRWLPNAGERQGMISIDWEAEGK